MESRQTLKLDYETEIPAQQVSGRPFQLATFAQMHLLGTVDPRAAKKAFDPESKLKPRELAHTIKENMRGWLRYTASQALQKLLSRPGADPLDPVLYPQKAAAIMRNALEPILGKWSFQIEKLVITYTVSESTMTALPKDFRQRLAAIAEEADTAAAFGPFNHQFEMEVPAVPEPTTKKPARVKAVISAIYTAHPEKCRETLDPEGGISIGALSRELGKQVVPWLQYGAKQAFYNALYRKDGQNPTSISDDEIMRQHAVELCREGIEGLGVLNIDLKLHYTPLDAATARAIGAPFEQSTEGSAAPTTNAIPPLPPLNHPPASSAPVAAGAATTNAAMSSADASAPSSLEQTPETQRNAAKTIETPSPYLQDDPPVAVAATQLDTGSQASQPEGPLPIEQALWNHQKVISQQHPNLGRRDLARKILEALTKDGYAAEERRRIGRLIGADSADLP